LKGLRITLHRHVWGYSSRGERLQSSGQEDKSQIEDLPPLPPHWYVTVYITVTVYIYISESSYLIIYILGIYIAINLTDQ